ncbi:MAG: arginine--tRNA ligase [Candidatus Altiarchaeia archaeon]
MYNQILGEIKESIEKAAGEAVRADELKESTAADVACTISFRLAGKLRRSPKEIAEDLASRIGSGGRIKKVEAVNGYLNFFMDYSSVVSSLLGEIRAKGKDYGRGAPLGKKIVLEHTSINPSGPLHIGRLRNCLIGDSLGRILAFSGYSLETHYFVNDVGKQIAIIARGFAEGLKPDEAAVNNYSEYAGKEDFQVFFTYVSANRRFEEDASFAARVQEHIRKAEGGDSSALDGITAVAKRCLSGQKQIYDMLDIKFDYFDYESAYIRNGAVTRVLEHVSRSPLVRRSEKGFGLDLSTYGLERRDSATILSRADGTSVYLSRDIAYHLEKVERGDIIMNVLGEDHKNEFLELTVILAEFFGVKKPMEAVHYSFVSFEGSELSTRKGQTAPVDKLIDEAKKKAAEEIEKRGIASKDVAPVIAIGAIKYHILKTSPQKMMSFRWEDALSFEGDSAPYLQYAHARSCSILEKAGADIAGINVRDIDTRLEKGEENLVKTLMRFPDAVAKAASERKPSNIASYVYELASCYSRFYKECQVISPEKKIMDRRLLLVDSTRQVLENGLYLLGIEAPKRM